MAKVYPEQRKDDKAFIKIKSTNDISMKVFAGPSRQAE